MNFILYQKERVNRKEISEGTIGNYYKAIKLFCEMNSDQPIVAKLIVELELFNTVPFTIVNKGSSVNELFVISKYLKLVVLPIGFTASVPYTKAL